MTYLLSNIARSCIQDHTINILYVPSMSVVDSIINSLPSINTIAPGQYWVNDIQAIVYGDTNSPLKYQDLLLKYHCKIIRLINDNQQNNDNNIYNLVLNINQFSIKTNSIKNKKLLYILDNDHSKATMILEYLNSLQINFTVFQPSEFIGIDIHHLANILAEFQFVLNNTNIENLIMPTCCGVVPITFVKDFVDQNDSIQLVDQNNFMNIITNKPKCVDDNIHDNSQVLLKDIGLHIKHLITHNQFIL